MHKYCSHCGQQASQNANYCTKCGRKLEDIKVTEEFPVENESPKEEPEKENSLCLSEAQESFEENHTDSTAQPLQDSFPAEDIDKISASCRLYNIQVSSSDTDEIKVYWEKTDSWSLIPQIKGRTLHLKERNRLGMHNIHDFFHNSSYKAIRIEVPKKKTFDWTLENETGSILVSDVNASHQAELKTSLGRVEVQNLKAGEALLVNTGTGSIHISEIEAGEIVRVNSQVGKIQAEGIKTATFCSNSTSGKGTFNDILTSGQVTVTGGVGELLLDNITSQKMDIRMNASGNINCQNLYSDSSIAIYNSVGNITCGIRDDAGNYTTHCHSEQGHNNYPEISGQGNKRLNVRTTLGSVDIFFTGVKEV